MKRECKTKPAYKKESHIRMKTDGLSIWEGWCTSINSPPVVKGNTGDKVRRPRTFDPTGAGASCIQIQRRPHRPCGTMRTHRGLWGNPSANKDKGWHRIIRSNWRSDPGLGGLYGIIMWGPCYDFCGSLFPSRHGLLKGFSGPRPCRYTLRVSVKYMNRSLVFSTRFLCIWAHLISSFKPHELGVRHSSLKWRTGTWRNWMPFLRWHS